MIPDFGPKGWMPYELKSGGVADDHSPYKTTLLEVIERFGFSLARRRLLDKLLAYRAGLARLGVTQGFQLLSGSFIEDCERLRGRPPRDIDLLTYAPREPAWATDPVRRGEALRILNERFVGENAQKAFGIDAHLVIVGLYSDENVFYKLVRTAVLFSTDKATDLAKGLICMPLAASDEEAAAALRARSAIR